MDTNLKREIILDNYESPRNRGLIDDKEYIKSDMNNESCIDHVIVEAKIENDVIKDVRFDGEACAICTSSASIMTEVVKGKNVDEAKELFDNFTKMIDGKDFDKDILEEAIVYEDIKNQPNRRKCACLSWWGINEILNKNKFDKNN